MNFGRFFRKQFLQNTSGWMFLFNNSCWLYTFSIVFFFFFSFSFTNACLNCQLRKAYAVLLGANRFVGSEIPEHNDFDQFWKIKFHFQHFPRSTRFLSFDGHSNYLYLFKKQQQTFRDQLNVRRPTSKLLKCDMDQTLNTFRNPSSWIFDAGTASLVGFRIELFMKWIFVA